MWKKNLKNTYHTMKFASFIPLWPSLAIFGLACAELTEVFGGFGRRVGEELHLDAA